VHPSLAQRRPRAWRFCKVTARWTRGLFCGVVISLMLLFLILPLGTLCHLLFEKLAPYAQETTVHIMAWAAACSVLFGFFCFLAFLALIIVRLVVITFCFSRFSLRQLMGM
jgi:hypothetical protein